MKNVLDLFSGIGGFSLGLERTGGFQTVCFCEWDDKAKLVLQKHWPDVPIAGDVKKLTVAKAICSKHWPANVVELWYENKLLYQGQIHMITGGFPCQDISCAGKQCGLKGERSGHFFEIIRIAGSIRPEYLLMENVSALLSISGGRDFGTVLAELDSVGFDAEWHCIPASYVGAPHIRDRVWILAYPHSERQPERNSAIVANTERWLGRDAIKTSLSNSEHNWHERRDRELQNIGIITHRRVTYCGRKNVYAIRRWWDAEPRMGRLADGVPGRVDRLKQLGNSVVPQIPEMLGYAILEKESL